MRNILPALVEKDGIIANFAFFPARKERRVKEFS